MESGMYNDVHHDENLAKIKEHEYYYDKHVNERSDL